MLSKHPRLSLLLLLTTVALLVVGARWWSSVPTSAPGEAEEKTATARAVEVESAGATIPQRATAEITPPDVAESEPLLADLRARLSQPNVVPGEALLTFRNREALDRFTRAAGSHGLEMAGSVPQLNTARVRYGSLENLRDLLAANPPGDATVEGNLWLAIPAPAPPPDVNNAGGTEPFGAGMLGAINAEGDRTGWGENVTVAVLDTGILGHPTFGSGQITHLDLVNDGQVFHSHGTSMASLIGGQNPQAPGVAPGARILDIRVANAEGYTVSSVLTQGIIAAVDRGAQVINISLGGYGESALLRQAIDYAAQRGVVVVAAAGNEGYGQLAVPAAYQNVLSVGSVDAQNRQAYFSNSGEGLDLAAPGVGVITAWDTDKVALTSGTSQSSAIVAAAAAAYLGWGVSPSAVPARLRADARPASAAAGTAGVGSLLIKPPAGR